MSCGYHKTDADPFPPKGTDEEKFLKLSESLESGEMFDDKNDPLKKGGEFLVNSIMDAPQAISTFTSDELAGKHS